MSKKILACMLILAMAGSLAGCGTGYTSGTENLTNTVDVISCTSEDPQAVKLNGLSEQRCSARSVREQAEKHEASWRTFLGIIPMR